MAVLSSAAINPQKVVHLCWYFLVDLFNLRVFRAFILFYSLFCSLSHIWSRVEQCSAALYVQ